LRNAEKTEKITHSSLTCQATLTKICSFIIKRIQLLPTITGFLHPFVYKVEVRKLVKNITFWILRLNYRNTKTKENIVIN